MVSSGLAPYKLPRALDSLLIYQQPSSTTLYYSYQERSSLTEIGLRNETGKLRVYQRSSQSNPPSFLKPQLRAGRMVSSDLATHKSPLAIVTLLLYQQSSSTISPYSYAKVTL